MKEKLIRLKNLFLEKKEYHLSYIYIIAMVMYWAYEPFNEELMGRKPVDGYRWLIVLISLVLHVLFVYKKISFNLSNFILQTIVIIHISCVIYLNDYHITFIIGFVLVMVLQSLTFKNRTYLLLFYSIVAFLILFLSFTDNPNRKIFIYNSMTGIVLCSIIALLKIKTDEFILMQKEEIHNLKIDKLNFKIHQNITTLSSSLTHEINTPLTTILGYTDLIKKLEKKKDFEHFLPKIENQVIKIKEITSVLGLLSSDPKQSENNEESQISSEEVKSYILNHVSRTFYKSEASFDFICNGVFSYDLHKGKMFFIFNEIFKLFSNEKKSISFTIELSESDIKVFVKKSENILQINDLNTMTAQVIANNYNYSIKEYKEENNIGIILEKNKEII